MCNPVPAVSHVQDLTETFLPQLRPAQQRGLAEWVAGALAAESGCEPAILSALEPLGVEAQALRARLREFLCDGGDRAAPCGTSLDVEACFAPLLGWVLAWWVGDTLPLAIDATSLRDRQVVLSISVLYRATSLFRRGPVWLHTRVLRGTRWWRALWLWPEALPGLPDDLTVLRHVAPPAGAYT